MSRLTRNLRNLWLPFSEEKGRLCSVERMLVGVILLSPRKLTWSQRLLIASGWFPRKRFNQKQESGIIGRQSQNAEKTCKHLRICLKVNLQQVTGCRWWQFYIGNADGLLEETRFIEGENSLLSDISCRQAGSSCNLMYCCPVVCPWNGKTTHAGDPLTVLNIHLSVPLMTTRLFPHVSSVDVTILCCDTWPVLWRSMSSLMRHRDLRVDSFVGSAHRVHLCLVKQWAWSNL